MRRLRFQEASASQTDALRAEFRDRLAGLVIEHEPQYRIVVLVTGADQVQDRYMSAGGTAVPVRVAVHDPQPPRYLTAGGQTSSGASWSSS